MTDTTKRNHNRHLAIRPDWLARSREAILEPELPIIDPHHHLWDHPGNRYFLPELLADLQTNGGSGHNIVATVFEECRAMYRQDGDPTMRPIGETEFVVGVAAQSDSDQARMIASRQYGKTRICEGIVGYADLNLGAAVRPVLEAQIKAGGGRFKGVRYITAWHDNPEARGSAAEPIPGILLQKKFREGFACLAPLGLTFDAWMYHTQLAELVDLARAFPQTTIVLNHVGGAIGIGPFENKRQEVLAEWRASMKALAACSNVAVKVGGMGMRLFGFKVQDAAEPPTGQQLADLWRPYVETSIEAFGANRCMFESNFPVDKGSCGYASLWNAFKILSKGATRADRAALFSGTAARVYRLTPVPC
jgi:L-fuconolactonase